MKLAWVALGCWGIAACGPSFDALQQPDIRFEHCNRLDLETGVANEKRRQCWSEWKRAYAATQTKDRVQYAEARLQDLDHPRSAACPAEAGAAAPECKPSPAR